MSKYKNAMAEHLAVAEKIMVACDDEGREPNEIEAKRVDSALNAIDRLEKLEKVEMTANRLHAPVTRATRPSLPEGPSSQVASFGPRVGRIFPEGGDRGGFNSLGEYIAAVVDPRKIRAGQTIGTPSQGGFLAPDGWGFDLLDFFVEQSPILSRCWVVPMKEGSLKLPAPDDRDHSGSIAGLAGVWLGEAATMSYDTVICRQIELTANKLGILTKMSREFAQDAGQSEWFVRNVMSKAARFYLDNSLVNGTGAGQPLGLLNAPGKITVDKEAGQVAQTLNYQNVVKMYEALTPEAEGAFWLCSPSVKDQLFALNAAVGAGGVQFWPALNQAQPINELLGMPIFYSEHCQLLGTEGDVFLINPRGYVIGMRQELIIDASPHVLFTTDETALRLIIRIDAQPVQSTYLTLKDGTTTVSDIVTLQTRS